MLNFFKCQPALNYGWARPELAWQDEALGEHARATADALVDIMRFWLDLGIDGFRVDMVNSLMKNDEDKRATIETWNYMFDHIRPAFPEAAFVPEWGSPYESMQARFDMDYYYYRKVKQASDKYEHLRVLIKKIALENHYIYGSRRIWIALHQCGHKGFRKGYSAGDETRTYPGLLREEEAAIFFL